MKNIILILSLFFLTVFGFAQDEALTIDAEGNVGIGTDTPSTKLEVEGNVQVNGDLSISGDIIPVGQDYSDWYVGNYYSIPTDQRSAEWDISIPDLPTTWTTYDISDKIPSGTKRIKVFIYVVGGGTVEQFIVQARPFGSTSTDIQRTGLIVLKVGKGGDAVEAHFAREIDIDVANGKFQLKDYEGLWTASRVDISLRGFYR